MCIQKEYIMQGITVGFIVLVVLYTIVAVADQISIQCGIYTPLFAATFVGLLLGDLQTGLIIGATLQLMTLGVATYGGATVPDYLSGAIMGTTYAIISGEGVEIGKVNVGNVAKREGSKNIKKSVNLTEQDIADIHEMIDAGHEVTAQMIPNESDQSILNYL